MREKLILLLVTCFVDISGEEETVVTQSAVTCSKLAIETLEQGVKYIQS